MPRPKGYLPETKFIGRLKTYSSQPTDWTRHAKAAPFKRNDQMLDVLPVGVMVFPGTGIQDNLADKARKLGIPIWKFGNGGA